MNQDDIINAIEEIHQKLDHLAEDWQLDADANKDDQRYSEGKANAFFSSALIVEEVLKRIKESTPNYPQNDIINTIQDDLTALYYTAKKLIRENEDKDSRSEFSLGKAIGIHYAAQLIETSLDDLLNPTQESSTREK